MTPEEIAAGMTGRLAPEGAGIEAALLPSPAVQNHAGFLAELPGGAVICAWFGGSLEGKSDICIRASLLLPGAAQWGPVATLSHDPGRSEQNPVIFAAPDGRVWLFHTAQEAGDQDGCRIRMAQLSIEGTDIRAAPGRFLDLPRGAFTRAPLRVLPDGGWLLPLFLCVPQQGHRWTGSHDISAMAISRDEGQSWELRPMEGSTGCVHPCPLPGAAGLVAFFRRRQADHVFRAEGTADGRGWSAPHPTDLLNNNSSLAAIRLAEGEVAVLCNPVNAAMSQSRRASLYDELGGTDARPDADTAGGCVPVWGVERAPLVLALSRDEGASFPERFLVADGPGTCLSNNSLDGRNRELSYPWLLETGDGALHLCYTLHRRAIRHLRLAPGWRAQLPRA
ncbi:sialidase family protein [Mangrovicoccus algicola]|uniref:Exo-alpha-sialidase n=1 Tax=Mangrovicoccus algicola TaxID=2771008 RepID=A0A8J6YWN2_9RHOB|nr:exo-alpha-sialidase [Mangrovicoccus algicola]MBE3640548.1 exo-alpha-sialidase [Mangrovicoccus algicola]